MNSPKQMQRLTPLWVISLFVSLTEVVTGIAVTQATGGVQVALTTFVIAFPILVAGMFFLILWSRPYVLYPPTEFSDRTEVGAFVRAMSNKTEVVQAIETEAISIRAGAGLESEVVHGRLAALEHSFRELLASQEKSTALLRAYEKDRESRTAVPTAEKKIFEENSAYRIHVTEVSGMVRSVDGQQNLNMGNAEMLAKELAKAGFKAQHSAWNRDFFLKELPDDRFDTLFLIHPGNDPRLLNRLKGAIEIAMPNVPLKVFIVEEFLRIAASTHGIITAEIQGSFNATVIYRDAL